ncbi:hypothetical protein H4Q26_003566 [Puccinia striiformis f. sp. tritici PST-130]|nr:hypothetical protein H4Q26_003566 [Puccinia striiformis f. sp. tritici PST-130]
MQPTANQFHPEHPKPVNYSSPAKPGQPRWSMEILLSEGQGQRGTISIDKLETGTGNTTGTRLSSLSGNTLANRYVARRLTARVSQMLRHAEFINSRFQLIRSRSVPFEAIAKTIRVTWDCLLSIDKTNSMLQQSITSQSLNRVDPHTSVVPIIDPSRPRRKSIRYPIVLRYQPTVYKPRRIRESIQHRICSDRH